MKTYDIFIKNIVYRVIHPKTLYEYIIVVKDDELKGFATLGFRNDMLERNNVYTIGTIYGIGIGDFLYSGVIKYFGPIIPTRNESDRAKMSWRRKFDDPKWKKYKISGVEFYDRYPEEDYLNYVYDLKINNTFIKEIDKLKNKDYIIDQLNILHKKVCSDLEKNKFENYTIGQSRDRDQIITDKGGDYLSVPYK